jgi:hypothetical protein
MPAVLEELMRDETVDTTMIYSVELDADEMAADLWDQYQESQIQDGLGTTSGTIADSEAGSADSSEDATPVGRRA